jgi:hypothetical protein
LSPRRSSSDLGFSALVGRVFRYPRRQLAPPVRDLEVRVVPSVSGSGALLLAASIISAYLARGIRRKYGRKMWTENIRGKNGRKNRRQTFAKKWAENNDGRIAHKQTPYLARASGLDFAKHGFGVFGQQQVGAFGRDAIKVRDRRVDFSRLGL